MNLDIELSQNQRKILAELILAGKDSRACFIARILLKIDRGEGQKHPPKTDDQILQEMNIPYSTIRNIRRNFHEHGLDGTLYAWKREIEKNPIIPAPIITRS